MLDSKLIAVDFLGEKRPIHVVASFDQFLDQFAVEVGGQLTDERCPFGVLLWPSARILAECLVQKPPFAVQQRLKIIELGCGVGFLSCALALLWPEAQIFACDYEPSLEAYVRANAQAWGVADRVQFQRLDWRQPVPGELRGQADWVLGADVFYDDSHLKHLPPYAFDLLRSEGRLTLADPKRFRFSAAMDLLKSHFSLISWDELDCNLDQEGIEDFMINRGIQQQKVSILNFSREKSL